MSYARHLHRMVDWDMADQIESSGSIKRITPHRPNKGRAPRDRTTYRWFRREMQKQDYRDNKR